MNRGGKDDRIEISLDANPYANMAFGEEGAGYQSNYGGSELRY
jgi:hypothetical protein